MHIKAIDTLRHGLQVLAFCCVVAVFTSMIWRDLGYGGHLVHSVSIGMLTWAVIEFGRLLVPVEQCYRDPERGGHGWPKGWRGIALTLLGVTVGYFGGTQLALLAIGGAHTVDHLNDLLLGLLVTLAAGTVASFYFFARGKQAALQASIAAAERDASEARLKLLQSQLEPHMLFNTLANLRALIGVDAQAAQHMVDRLNDYLRATLGASRVTWHPLADEFARLADYLALMAIRMGPRLQVELDLPAALRDQPVPPLLLQPLVENALQHGLEPRVQGGLVRVAAQRVGHVLQLEVSDTGVGFDPTLLRADRFGLTQVLDRVATAYGGRGHVDVQSVPGDGTRVRIHLPLDGFD